MARGGPVRLTAVMTTITAAPAPRLTSISALLERTDDAIRQGLLPGAVVVPTGFRVLDDSLDGGLRSGELVMLGGAQGLGKSTLVTQLVRNVVRAGGSAVVFSYESEVHTILERLISLEAAAAIGLGSTKLRSVRRAFEVQPGQPTSMEERLALLPGALEGLEAIRRYADRLHLHESATSTTDLAEIERVVRVVEAQTGIRPLVVIDHLQKVPLTRGPARGDEEQIAVVERLKDLTVALGVPMVVVTGAGRAQGAGAAQGSLGIRTRVADLRGSAAVAHEADVVLLLNEKYDIVARHHLVYDLGNADRFKEWLVMTIEKNRHGVDKIELEFRKRFSEGRFDAQGQLVMEQLVEERLYTE